MTPAQPRVEVAPKSVIEHVSTETLATDVTIVKRLKLFHATVLRVESLKTVTIGVPVAAAVLVARRHASGNA